MQKKNIILYLILIFVLIIFLSYWRLPVLVLEDSTDDRIVFITRVSFGDEFTIAWMHSVELQPWEEIFRIDEENNIILERTRFKSFGAGVPASAGEKSEIMDGWVIFSEINKKIPEITYGISSYGKHKFYMKNINLNLYEMMSDGNALRIKTDTISLLSYSIEKIKNNPILH